MNKYKLRYTLYVLITCCVLVSIGFFYLGTHFGKTEVEVNNQVKIESFKDENLEKIKLEVNNLIDILNGNIDKCSIFKSKFLTEEDNDLLTKLSPYLMECMYNETYENNEMSEEEYQNFKKVFNVYLINEDGKYKFNSLEETEEEALNFSLSNIKKNLNYYEVTIKIESSEDIKDARLLLSIQESLVYYISFNVK